MAELAAYHPAIRDIEMPARIRLLPVDPQRRVPVPWFVEWVNGEPDFRIASTTKFLRALKERRCWVCGEPLGRWVAYVVGPMCGINRTSAEPPVHRDCGIYSARACPFLREPKLVRNEHEPLPDGAKEGKVFGGIGIRRNPGVALVWVQRGATTVQKVPNGYVCKMGDPFELLWYRESREATRAEIDESVATGLPILRQMAEEDGPEAVMLLGKMLADFEALLPAP